jgi:hypothetical protein
VKFSTLGKDGGLSVSIDDPAFKDLAVFRGANLASLTLYGTSVSDLTPLAGLPLKELPTDAHPGDRSLAARRVCSGGTQGEGNFSDRPFRS